MTGYPAFGTLLTRLLGRRGLDVGSLAEAARVAESDLREVVDGAAPSPSLLRSLAPVLGLHAADLFVIAQVPVPDELAPLDPEAGPIVENLVWDAICLPPDQRAEILRVARSLPQKPRTRAAAETRVFNRFEPSFGAALVAMLCDNRNIRGWTASAKVIACLTDGRMYLSAPTIAGIAGSTSLQKPEWLAGLATTLGIPIGDLSALTGIDLPEGAANQAAADMAELIWEARRLTADQVRTIRALAQALRSRLPEDVEDRALYRERIRAVPGSPAFDGEDRPQ